MVLDGLTLWVSNLMAFYSGDTAVLHEADSLAKALAEASTRA